MCHEMVARKMDRRTFLKSAAAAAMAGVVARPAFPALAAADGQRRVKGVVDLTHRLVHLSQFPRPASDSRRGSVHH